MQTALLVTLHLEDDFIWKPPLTYSLKEENSQKLSNLHLSSNQLHVKVQAVPGTTNTKCKSSVFAQTSSWEKQNIATTAC